MIYGTDYELCWIRKYKNDSQADLRFNDAVKEN